MFCISASDKRPKLNCQMRGCGVGATFLLRGGQACFTRTNGKTVAPSRAETPGLACSSLRILGGGGDGVVSGRGEGDAPGYSEGNSGSSDAGGVGAAHTHPTMMPRTVPWCTGNA